MRYPSVRQFLSIFCWSVCAIAIALSLAGCSIFGGDGGDGGSYSAPVDARNVTGRVLVPDSAPRNIVAGGIRADTFAGRAGIRVAIEEMPEQYFDDTDENGVYVLENVPVGNWHVVAWLEPGGQPYRVRSVTITADSSSAVAITVEDLTLVKADRVVNGKLVNAAGVAIPAGTKMWCWGREFSVGDKGLFTSPALPPTATQAQLIVAETATTRRYAFTAPFVATAPATLLVVVPGKDANANLAPIVTLEARVGNVVKTTVGVNELVTLIASATDAETPNANNLSVKWSKTKGTLTVNPNDKYRASFQHNAAGIATITVQVGDGQATGSVQLPILIGVTSPAQVPDLTPPTVNLTTPANNSVDQATNTTIVLNFNEAVDPTTLTVEELLVLPSFEFENLPNVRAAISKSVNPFVTGTIAFSNSNKTVTFTPTHPLMHGTTYSVVLLAGVQDGAGNPIAEDKEWTFSTIAAPEVKQVSPLQNSVNQLTSSNISITFDRDMKAGTFEIVVKDNENNSIAGTVTPNAGNSTVFTFDPTNNLVFGRTYTVTVTTKVTDILGNGLPAPYIYTFQTGNAPTVSFNYANNATKVPLSGPFVLTFSQPMKEATLAYGTNVRLELAANPGVAIPGNAVLGTSANGGTTITFTPTNPLADSTNHKIVVTTSTENSLGEKLQQEFTSTFQTQGPAPTISSSIPANGASDVPTNTPVSVTFGQALDANTVNSTNILFTANGSAVSGTWSYDDTDDVYKIVFNTTGNQLLPNSANCVITITPGLKTNLGGNFATDQTRTFTTAPKFTPPPQGEGTTAGNSVSAINSVNGDVYVAGYTLEGSIGKAYLLKYSSNGGAPAIIIPPSTGDTRATGIAVDVNNSAVYICGYTTGTFSTGSNKGRIDAFVARYDFSAFPAAGQKITANPAWVKQIGSSANEEANGITVDTSNGYVYVTGSSMKGAAIPLNDGTQDLAPSPSSTGDATPCFLIKLNSSTGAIPNSTPSGPFGLALIGSGSGIHIGNACTLGTSYVYIAGTTYGYAPTGGGVASGGTDIFIAQVDPGSMALGSVVQIGGPGFDRATCISYPGNDYIYVGGSSNGNIPALSHVNGGQYDMIVFRLTWDTLAFVSAQSVKTSGDDNCYGLQVINGGYALITGCTTGTAGTSSFGEKDVVLAKFTENLSGPAPDWTSPIQIGTERNDVATSLSIQSAANPNLIYLTGWSEGGIDGSTNSSGNSKVFMLKYDATGYKY